MLLKDKYQIERNYISFGASRSGKKLTTGEPTFLVAHEVGGNGDADAHFRYFNSHPRSASAHTFIDDKKILEIVPLDEKAWHVQYQKPTDNEMFGEDANDVAIGTELCRTDFEESYDRYVWYHAYLCHKFNLNPQTKIIDHKTLDPERRSDPDSWLKPNGKTFKGFINDVVRYYENWEKSFGESEELYRVRKSWDDSKSQLGAYKILDNAKRKADENEGHFVFNSEGQLVYPIVKEEPKEESDVKVINKNQFLIKVLVDNLHTYTKPDWDAKKHAPIVNKNDVFTVVETLEVKGYKMYKLISGWYITASTKYVEVIKDEPKPEPKKKYISFPKYATSWRVYPLDKAPTKGNEKGFLNPSKYDGLTYEILGEKEPFVYIIKSAYFGTVKAYGHPSTGAKVFEK